MDPFVSTVGRYLLNALKTCVQIGVGGGGSPSEGFRRKNKNRENTEAYMGFLQR